MLFKLNSTARRRACASFTLGAAAIMTAVLLGPAANAQQSGGAITLPPSHRALTVIEVPSSDLKLDVRLDRQNAVYPIGQDLRLTIRVNKDAYVTVFNTDAMGRTMVVFPNKFAQNNRIRAGETVSIPAPNTRFKLQVGGPLGVNLVKVIASRKRRPLTEAAAFAYSGGFRAYRGRSTGLARHLQAVMQGAPKAGWAMADLPFRVATSTAAIGTPSVVVNPAPAVVTAGNLSGAVAQLAAVPSGFGLRMTIQGQRFRVGNSLALTVAAEKDCRLHIINVDRKGQATVLFPNRLQEDNLIKAGRIRFLPGSGSGIEYQVAGTPGQQALVALCTLDKPSWIVSLFSRNRAAVPVLSQAELASIVAQIGKTPAAKVGRAVVTYMVEAQ